MSKKVPGKFYAFAHDPRGIDWVWSTQNRWMARHTCTPKPLSYKYAMKKANEEFKYGSDISRVTVILDEEYERNGL